MFGLLLFYFYSTSNLFSLLKWTDRLLREGVVSAFTKLGVAIFDFSLTMLNKTKGFLHLSYFFYLCFVLSDWFLTKLRFF